jgi:hypothetical protein
MSKKSDPSVLRDKLFEKIGFLAERLCQKKSDPSVLRDKLFEKIGFLTEFIFFI